MRLTMTIFITAILIACNNEKQNDTKETNEAGATVIPATDLVFDQLVGLWQAEDGKSFEKWIKQDDGRFRSVAFSVKGIDTSWNEQADIYPENGHWVFENTVKGQNAGKAIKFISSSLSANSVQFSNPAHDFPTDINYTLPDANTIKAFIVGPNAKGGKDTIPFNYIRIK